MSYEAQERAVKEKLAQISGTQPNEWYLVFKARYGMFVAFDQLRKARGDGSVITQAFTCATAVDPIVAAGLTPHYVDIEESTVMVDPALVQIEKDTKALVIQHTFGIMAPEQSLRLATLATEAGVFLLEDSAHALGQLSRGPDGRPLADVSIHSFGIEKMLPTRFGGAVWVNPDMRDRDLHGALCTAFEALPVLDAVTSAKSRLYPYQNAVFNRIPAGIGPKLRSAFTSHSAFEPPISSEELEGQLPYAPMKPAGWMLEAIGSELSRLEEVRAQKREATAAYLEALAGTGVAVPSCINASLPLVRFPFFMDTAGQAERAIEAARRSGYFAGHWYRPLLFPGPEGPGLGFDPDGTDLPVSRSLAARVVNFQTHESPARCQQIVANTLPGRYSDATAKQGSSRGEGPDGFRLGNADFVPVFLGTGLGAYALARSLHDEYGVRSLAIGRARLDDTADSSIIEVRTYAGFGDPEFIVETLLELQAELGNRKILLVPTIEFYTNVVVDHREHFGAEFLIPLPSKDVVDRLIDKKLFHQTCQAAGLPVPQTTFISREDFEGGWRTAGKDLSLPLIIKPTDTDTYQRVLFQGKKKIYRADSQSEADRIVSLVYSSDYAGDLALQQYLPGGEEVMRVANTYSDPKGKVKFVSVGQVVLTELNPQRVGNNNAIVTVSDPDLTQKMCAFLEDVGYRGIANFDFMFDKEAGEYKVLEVNLRAGATNFYTMAAGGTLAKQMVETLVYEKDVPFLETEAEGLWVNVPAPIFMVFANREMKDLYREAIRKGSLHTLDYAPDRSLRRQVRKAKANLRMSLDHVKYRNERLNQ